MGKPKKKHLKTHLHLMLYRNRGICRLLSCTCKSLREVYVILNSGADCRTK